MAGRKDDLLQIKLLTIGDSAVGKTCLLLQYSAATFQKTFITTIGIDFKTKYVTIDGKQVRLQIWDTAGQERFRTITTSYFNGAHGIMLVYDVCDRASFNSIRNWVDQIRQHADIHVNMMLVGNKIDLLADEAHAQSVRDSGGRPVSHAEGEALAAEYAIPFRSTSAKHGTNVDEAFFDLARDTFTRVVSQERSEAGNGGGRAGGRHLEGGGGRTKSGGGCC